jgi:ubiquinone/menaquinone biosynthesis C-methylase UbiE
MEVLSAHFYEENSKKFSDTRFCLWDVVRDFGENFKKESLVLDAGCGNGKNMHYFKDICNIVGIDKCNSLVTICNDKGYNVSQSEINNIPFNENIFDHIICIAVLHHLELEENRINAIQEMIRVLKPGGKLLLTCWAFESDEYSKKKNFKKGDNFVKFNKEEILRYYYIYDKEGFKQLCEKAYNNVDITWDRGNWNAIFTK